MCEFKINESEKVWHKVNIQKEVWLRFSGSEKDCQRAVDYYLLKIKELLGDGWELCGCCTEVRGHVNRPMCEAYPDDEYWVTQTDYSAYASNKLKKRFSQKEIEKRLKLTKDTELNKILKSRRIRSERNQYRAQIENRIKLIDAYENTDCRFEVFDRKTGSWNKSVSPSFDNLQKMYRRVE